MSDDEMNQHPEIDGNDGRDLRGSAPWPHQDDEANLSDELAPIDAWAGRALRAESGVNDALRMDEMTNRILAASAPIFRRESSNTWRFVGHETDSTDAGPSMLPISRGASRWYFLALAACVVIAVSLALRFSIQVVPTSPQVGNETAQKEKNQKAAIEFTALSAELREDASGSSDFDLASADLSGSWSAWRLDASSLSAGIQSAYSGMSSDEDHDLIEQTITDMDAVLNDLNNVSDDAVLSGSTTGL